MKKTRWWLMVVCALFLCVSVAKADDVAAHKISVESNSSIFDSATNTFTFTPESDRTFSFSVAYQFLDSALFEFLTSLQVNIKFDDDILNYVGTQAWYSDNLVGRQPPTLLALGDGSMVRVGWNDAYGDVFGGSSFDGYLLKNVTFALRDDISFEEFFSTEITFVLANPGGYPIDPEPIITVRFVPDHEDNPPSNTPEPATLLIVGLGLAGLGAVAKRRRK